MFLAIGHAGSLAGAARALKVDHATVSRRLGALEAELQVRLVDRLPRACRLTAVGLQVFALASEMEASAFAVQRVVRAEHSPAAGRVVLSAPPVLASNFLAATLRRFQQQYPQVQLSIVSQVHSVSLGRREADIAVRLYRPTEPDSVTRKVGSMPFGLYASVDYEHLRAPAQWQFITYGPELADMPHQQWMMAVSRGRPVACEVTDLTTQHAAVRTGVGVAGLPRFMGDADPLLQHLPFEGEGFAREIWLVLHADLRHSPLLRAVMAFLVDVISETFDTAP